MADESPNNDNNEPDDDFFDTFFDDGVLETIGEVLGQQNGSTSHDESSCEAVVLNIEKPTSISVQNERVNVPERNKRSAESQSSKENIIVLKPAHLKDPFESVRTEEHLKKKEVFLKNSRDPAPVERPPDLSSEAHECLSNVQQENVVKRQPTLSFQELLAKVQTFLEDEPACTTKSSEKCDLEESCLKKNPTQGPVDSGLEQENQDKAEILETRNKEIKEGLEENKSKHTGKSRSEKNKTNEDNNASESNQIDSSSSSFFSSCKDTLSKNECSDSEELPLKNTVQESDLVLDDSHLKPDSLQPSPGKRNKININLKSQILASTSILNSGPATSEPQPSIAGRSSSNEIPAKSTNTNCLVSDLSSSDDSLTENRESKKYRKKKHQRDVYRNSKSSEKERSFRKSDKMYEKTKKRKRKDSPEHRRSKDHKKSSKRKKSRSPSPSRKNASKKEYKRGSSPYLSSRSKRRRSPFVSTSLSSRYSQQNSRSPTRHRSRSRSNSPTYHRSRKSPSPRNNRRSRSRSRSPFINEIRRLKKQWAQEDKAKEMTIKNYELSSNVHSEMLGKVPSWSDGGPTSTTIVSKTVVQLQSTSFAFSPANDGAPPPLIGPGSFPMPRPNFSMYCDSRNSYAMSANESFSASQGVPYQPGAVPYQPPVPGTVPYQTASEMALHPAVHAPPVIPKMVPPPSSSKITAEPQSALRKQLDILMSVVPSIMPPGVPPPVMPPGVPSPVMPPGISPPIMPTSLPVSFLPASVPPPVIPPGLPRPVMPPVMPPGGSILPPAPPNNLRPSLIQLVGNEGPLPNWPPKNVNCESTMHGQTVLVCDLYTPEEPTSCISSETSSQHSAKSSFDGIVENSSAPFTSQEKSCLKNGNPVSSQDVSKATETGNSSSESKSDSLQVKNIVDKKTCNETENGVAGDDYDSDVIVEEPPPKPPIELICLSGDEGDTVVLDDCDEEQNKTCESLNVQLRNEKSNTETSAVKSTSATVETSAGKSTSATVETSAVKSTSATVETSAVKSTSVTVETSAVKSTSATVETSAVKSTSATVETTPGETASAISLTVPAEVVTALESPTAQTLNLTSNQFTRPHPVIGQNASFKEVPQSRSKKRKKRKRKGGSSEDRSQKIPEKKHQEESKKLQDTNDNSKKQKKINESQKNHSVNRECGKEASAVKSTLTSVETNSEETVCPTILTAPAPDDTTILESSNTLTLNIPSKENTKQHGSPLRSKELPSSVKYQETSPLKECEPQMRKQKKRDKRKRSSSENRRQKIVGKENQEFKKTSNEDESQDYILSECREMIDSLRIGRFAVKDHDCDEDLEPETIKQNGSNSPLVKNLVNFSYTRNLNEKSIPTVKDVSTSTTFRLCLDVCTNTDTDLTSSKDCMLQTNLECLLCVEKKDLIKEMNSELIKLKKERDELLAVVLGVGQSVQTIPGLENGTSTCTEDTQRNFNQLPPAEPIIAYDYNHSSPSRSCAQSRPDSYLCPKKPFQ